MGKIKKLWMDRQIQYTYMRWLLGYARPYLGRIILLILVNLLSTIVTLIMAIISKKVIDDATAGNDFIYLIIVYLIMIIVVQIAYVLSNLISAILNERFSYGIRKQIYETIIHSHWMDVKKYHTGDLMTRLTSDTSSISDGIVGTLPGIIQLVLELIMVFFTLFYYSPLLAVFALLVAPVAALTAWWMGKKLKGLQVKVQESEAEYRSFLQESLSNLLIIKAFANEKYAADKLTGLKENRFFWVFKRIKLSIASSVAMSMSFQLGYIVAFAYGAVQISKQIITYGTMSVFLTLVNRIQSPIVQLAQQVPKVVSILASAGRVMELQELPQEETKKNSILADDIGVNIEELTFGYTQETVLEDVSMNIRPGEFVAIIGESGIGKTTLVRIIMSFLSSTLGTVEFYNTKGEKEAANAGSRHFIAYVPQGNTLFSGTIRENIRMGKLDAAEHEIINALKLSAGYDFVMALPDGLDTVIGERGHGLSEGQAQRIAIARAFVRNASLLVLDEATSSLDEQTELSVLEGLKKLSPGPTCIIITHRKSILRYCDREIKINEKGTQEKDI